MASRASVAKHPLHPMFIVFPIGLWVFSLVCDIIYAVGGNLAWELAAYYATGIGIIGALIAAVFGVIDLFSLPANTRARKVGYWHMGINLAVTAIFIVSYFLRGNSVPGAVAPFVLTIIGVAGLLVSGWLGGELVYVEGVAVEGRTKTEELPKEEEPRLRRVA